MRRRTTCITFLALLFLSTPAHAGDWIANPQERITHALHQRLKLYLYALNAPLEEQKELQAQDPAQGIWLMQLNPFLRARMRLVERLTPREREELISKGRIFVSEPYAKLPKPVQGWMAEALGVDRLDPARRNAMRYQLRRTLQDGAHQVIISQVEPTGRPTSGGSVMPGILDSPPTKP